MDTISVILVIEVQWVVIGQTVLPLDAITMELNFKNDFINFLKKLREKSINSGVMALPENSAYLLCLITYIYRENNLKIVELGSGLLYSALWMFYGIFISGKKGEIYTVEKNDEIYKESLRVLEETSEILKIDLKETIKPFKKDASLLKGNEFGKDIDVLFLDIDKKLYLESLKKFFPYVKKEGLIIAHNVISHKDELKNFLEEISNFNKYFTLILETDPQGISVSIKR
ncbi:MAG: hypothetical protein ABIM54_02160 [candidate division WOR-3 bacterium]